MSGRRPRRAGHAELPAMELIARLRSGEVSGRTLRKADRVRVVEYLTVEGASVAEIARLLGLSERSVHRDRAAVREANALRADEGFAAVFLGELLAEMRLGIERVRRAARDPQARPGNRIEAERVAGELRAAFADLLVRTGLLPSAPRPVATVVHAAAPLPEDPEAEVRLLRSLAAAAPALPAEEPSTSDGPVDGHAA